MSNRKYVLAPGDGRSKPLRAHAVFRVPAPSPASARAALARALAGALRGRAATPPGGGGFASLIGRKAPQTHKNLRVRLDIDPAEAQSQNDRFTLESVSGSVSQTLTVKDDLIPGDAWVDLLYENLDTSLAYSLRIERDARHPPYYLFRGVPFARIAQQLRG